MKIRIHGSHGRHKKCKQHEKSPKTVSQASSARIKTDIIALCASYRSSTGTGKKTVDQKPFRRRGRVRGRRISLDYKYSEHKVRGLLHFACKFPPEQKCAALESWKPESEERWWKEKSLNILCMKYWRWNTDRFIRPHHHASPCMPNLHFFFHEKESPVPSTSDAFTWTTSPIRADSISQWLHFIKSLKSSAKIKYFEICFIMKDTKEILFVLPPSEQLNRQVPLGDKKEYHRMTEGSFFRLVHPFFSDS